MPLSKPLGHALVVANILCTLLVVSVHYASGDRSDIVEEFFRNGLARVSSPFFALIAGFFVYREVNDLAGYVEGLKKRARSLLLPYLLVTVSIAAFLWLREAVARGRPAHPGFGEALLGSIVDPASVQLWFLRDVIFMVLLSHFIRARVFWVDAAVVLVLGVGWMADFQPMPLLGSYHLISIDVLFFFLLGGLLSGRPQAIESVSRMPLPLLVGVTGVWAALIAWRIAIDPHFDRWYVRAYTAESLFLYKSAILVGLMALIGWAGRIRSEAFKKLRAYTFFVYLFHLQPVQAVAYHAVGRFLDKRLYFYVLFPTALLLTLALAVLLSRFMPSAFALLTGGRGARRGDTRTGEGTVAAAAVGAVSAAVSSRPPVTNA